MKVPSFKAVLIILITSFLPLRDGSQSVGIPEAVSRQSLGSAVARKSAFFDSIHTFAKMDWRNGEMCLFAFSSYMKHTSCLRTPSFQVFAKRG